MTEYKCIRIEMEYANGLLERAEGADATAIADSINNSFAFMQIHGAPYSGSRMQVVRKPHRRSEKPVSANKHNYKADLLGRLDDLRYAVFYLTAAAKESQETFFLALRDVVEAIERATEEEEK